MAAPYNYEDSGVLTAVKPGMLEGTCKSVCKRHTCTLLLHIVEIPRKLSAPGAAATLPGLGLGFLALGGLSAFSRASAASSAAFCRAAALSQASFGSLPFEMSCSNARHRQ
jgi:hypothetical protein